MDKSGDKGHARGNEMLSKRRNGSRRGRVQACNFVIAIPDSHGNIMNASSVCNILKFVAYFSWLFCSAVKVSILRTNHFMTFNSFSLHALC